MQRKPAGRELRRPRGGRRGGQGAVRSGPGQPAPPRARSRETRRGRASCGRAGWRPFLGTVFPRAGTPPSGSGGKTHGSDRFRGAMRGPPIATPLGAQARRGNRSEGPCPRFGRARRERPEAVDPRAPGCPSGTCKVSIRMPRTDLAGPARGHPLQGAHRVGPASDRAAVKEPGEGPWPPSGTVFDGPPHDARPATLRLTLGRPTIPIAPD